MPRNRVRPGNFSGWSLYKDYQFPYDYPIEVPNLEFRQISDVRNSITQRPIPDASQWLAYNFAFELLDEEIKNEEE